MPTKYKVGDKVIATEDGGVGRKVGDIGEIIGIHPEYSSSIRVDWPGQKGWLTLPNTVRKATKREIANANKT